MTSSIPSAPWRRFVDRVRSAAGRPGKVAFVFSGGGNLGAVQVGMLKALVEAGIKPDIVVGCSVGAINGAAYAAEPGAAAVARLERIWGRLADGDPDLMPTGFIPLVAQMARKGESLHDQQTLAGLLDDELPAKTFADLSLPFSCVATDVEAATERWFDEGRLVPALLASAALPAVYPPFVRGGREYIDGGVLNEVHADRAVALGATELYVMHVGHLDERVHDLQRPFDGAIRAYWTARRYRMEDDMARIPDRCIVHRLPAGSTPRLRFDDFSQGRELARLAYEATAEYLSTGRAPSPVTGPISEPLPDGADDDGNDGEGRSNEASALLNGSIARPLIDSMAARRAERVNARAEQAASEAVADGSDAEADPTADADPVPAGDGGDGGDEVPVDADPDGGR